MYMQQQLSQLLGFEWIFSAEAEKCQAFSRHGEVATDSRVPSV